MKSFVTLILSIGVILLTGFSCNGGKKAQKQKLSSNSIPTDFYFKMEKTPCYGTCPIYQVEVFSNGRVRLKGKRFLDWIGSYETILSQDTLLWLFEYLKKADLFQYQDRYDNQGVTDVPSTIITYVADGKKKTIFMRFDVPEALRELDSQLHHFFMRQSYKKVEEKQEED